MTKLKITWTDVYLCSMVLMAFAWASFPFLTEPFHQKTFEARLGNGLATGIVVLAIIIVCMVCIALMKRKCHPKL